MPQPPTLNLTSTQSQIWDTVLDAIVLRLVSTGGLDATTDNVQVICAPDDGLNEYLAQTGYRIRVLPPEPTPMAGAGRNGYISQRRVDVFIVSESLLDPGGQDDKAVRAHLRKESLVIDALTLSPPYDVAYSQTVSLVGDLIKHIPGGSDMSRLLKANPGLIVSAVPFAVTYVPQMVVKRV